MKNIVCPISTERVSEHLPRITALFVISLLGVYLFTGFFILLAFLFVDFLARATGYSRFSLLHNAAIELSKIFNFKSALVDKAPKLFAARLGTIMMAIALAFELTSFTGGAITISFMVVAFAFLECVANFCVGCYVYSLFVLPIFISSK